ncbi:sirohydrochlorin chelatase [Nocardia thailandica]|uniref:Sirohydrochlorin chelatase n=1 Tax=Nocardia thailandica TaxID=257275 RepID=A0ABW6PHW0_9NOCA
MRSPLAPARGTTSVPGGRGEGVSGPALILVAHGSRDPRSAATVAEVGELVTRQFPAVDVRTAFLDLNTPSVEQVADAVAADGHAHAVAVPLLLGRAFHARVDLPGLLAGARHRHPALAITQAGVLGPDPRLVAALCERVAEVAGGPDPDLGIAVAAVGSTRPGADRRTAAVAAAVADLTGCRTEICFATTAPTVDAAVGRLRARGARRVVVAPWFLAPGLLTDRLRSRTPDLAHALPLGAHPAVAEVIGERFRRAAAQPLTLSA